MKIRNSLRSLKQRHRNCRVVKRRGKVYVINKVQRRFKARQGWPQHFNRWTWIIVTTSKTLESSQKEGCPDYSSTNISDQEIENSVGELLLNYPLTDATGSDVIYNADLYLNDTLGLLTTTLVPGTIGKKVGLDFGFYDLNFLFWFQKEKNT